MDRKIPLIYPSLFVDVVEIGGQMPLQYVQISDLCHQRFIKLILQINLNNRFYNTYLIYFLFHWYLCCCFTISLSFLTISCGDFYFDEIFILFLLFTLFLVKQVNRLVISLYQRNRKVLIFLFSCFDQLTAYNVCFPFLFSRDIDQNGWKVSRSDRCSYNVEIACKSW